MTVAMAILAGVGAVLLVAAVVVRSATRRAPVPRVVVTGHIVRQASLSRTPTWEFRYPLPDGTWATGRARGPVSMGSLATAGWREGTPVPVHVSTADVHDARLVPDGGTSPGGVVALVLGIVGGVLLLVGGLGLLAAAAA